VNWIIKTGNILDEPADVLICSANIHLNLSGGVGGEILLRHGDAMQRELHAYLTRNNLRFLQQGDVVQTAPRGLPYRAVLHAVAVNGFYETSPEILRRVIDKSLRMAASLEATSVALTALATGFGRLTMRQFGESISCLQRDAYSPLKCVTICVRHEKDRINLATAFEAPRDHRDLPAI
jgi:O-acetyl-ADP-ribose deacetylase